MRDQPVRAVRLLLVLIATSILMQPLRAQENASVRPAPRLPNGEVSFGAPPGEIGTWSRSDTRSMMPELRLNLRCATVGAGPIPAIR